MERFFKLGDINTWSDWSLVLTSKDVSPPEPKTNYVELDGMSGSLDLSEALSGEITYKDRTVSASFWTSEGSRKDRARLIQKIIATLHGKKIKIIEPDDPDHYFYGRVKIKGFNNVIPYTELNIEATCEPWRYALENISRTLVVKSNENIKVVINNNGVKTLCPTITVNGRIDLSYKDVTASLSTGTYIVSDIKLYQGDNIISVSGTDTGTSSVTFTYREADL